MSDYIKRDSVLNDIGELFTLCYETLPNECGHHFIVEKELKIHWDYVKGLPPEDVRENVHAHWVRPTIINGRSFDILHCSACGGVPCGVDKSTKFCACCGAKMDGGDEQ